MTIRNLINDIRISLKQRKSKSRRRSGGRSQQDVLRIDLLEARYLLAGRPWEFLDASSQIDQPNDTPGDPMFRAVQPGDFNKDGQMDFVVVQARSVAGVDGNPERGILYLNENGRYVDRTAQYFPGLMTPAVRWWIVPHDFFKTGWVDLYVGGAEGMPSKFYKNLGNDANGQWLGFADQSSRIQGPSATATDSYHQHKADLDGDSWMDIVEYQNHPETGLGQIRILMNNQTQFVDETSTRMPLRQETSLFGHVEDLSGDGFPDISISNLFPTGFIPEIRVLINDGTGKFPTSLEQTIPQPSNSGGTYGLEHVDVNGDDKLDIYVINYGTSSDSFRDAVLLNLGTGNNRFNTVYFPEHPNGLKDSDGDHPVSADFDGDGKMDIAVAQFATKTFMLHNETVNGVTKLVEMTPPQIPETSGFRARAFDFNGDGVQDLIVAKRPVDSGISLMIGNVSEVEPNHSPFARRANAITTFPALITGTVATASDKDVFTLPARAIAEGTRIRLIPTSSADLKLEVLGSFGNVLATSQNVGNGMMEELEISAGSGALLVRVTSQMPAVQATYRLEVDELPISGMIGTPISEALQPFSGQRFDRLHGLPNGAALPASRTSTIQFGEWNKLRPAMLQAKSLDELRAESLVETTQQAQTPILLANNAADNSRSRPAVDENGFGAVTDEITSELLGELGTDQSEFLTAQLNSV